MQNSINDEKTPVFAPGELDYYAKLEEPESDFFAQMATKACGRGPWKKLGRWLVANTRPVGDTTRKVFSGEGMVALFIVQAWATRLDTSQHRATTAEMFSVEHCVYLMARHLRSIAPNAIKKAMRNDD